MEKLFVVGGTGFVGTPLVENAVADYHVQVLVRSEKSAAQVRTCGAEPVIGDLTRPGPWQEVAASATYLIHLAQPQALDQRLTVKSFRQYNEQRLLMDQHLLGCLQPGVPRRIVYIGSSNYFGDLGLSTYDEAVQPNLKGLGAYLAPAIQALPGYTARGLPIIEAFPGGSGVYGPGSWFDKYGLSRLINGKPVISVANSPHKISFIHVEDCARALLYLLAHGEVGKRYFVVDDNPIELHQLYELAAKELGVPYRALRMPRLLALLLLGPIITELATINQCLSNQRLRSLGFEFRFPTIREGVPAAVAAWKAQRTRSAEVIQ